jgi:hypothetical protein
MAAMGSTAATATISVRRGRQGALSSSNGSGAGIWAPTGPPWADPWRQVRWHAAGVASDVVGLA